MAHVHIPHGRKALRRMIFCELDLFINAAAAAVAVISNYSIAATSVYIQIFLSLLHSAAPSSCCLSCKRYQRRKKYLILQIKGRTCQRTWQVSMAGQSIHEKNVQHMMPVQYTYRQSKQVLSSFIIGARCLLPGSVNIKDYSYKVKQLILHYISITALVSNPLF